MDIQELIGKTVHVVVDRPVGYLHRDILYPINYGYIPGVMAGDGEEQDVYILGVSGPIAAFDGRVIAVIRRLDDVEDKLVAAPEGMTFSKEEIMESVRFQLRAKNFQSSFIKMSHSGYFLHIYSEGK